MKLVLDSNIFISAFYWGGKPQQVIDRVILGLDELRQAVLYGSRAKGNYRNRRPHWRFFCVFGVIKFYSMRQPCFLADKSWFLPYTYDNTYDSKNCIHGGLIS